MLKTLLRPAMILFPLAVGLLFPRLHVLNAEPWRLVRYCLMVMIFLSCLRIDPRDLRPRREHALIFGFNLLAGIVPYVLFRLFQPGSPELAEAAFFTGITPTAAAAPAVVGFLHGRVGFALTGFTLTNCGIALALPFLLPAVTGNFTLVFFRQAAETLGVVIALPVLAAFLLRLMHPSVRGLPAGLSNVSFVLWSVVICLLAATACDSFRRRPGMDIPLLAEAGAVSLALCGLNFFAGALLSRRRFKREGSQILGQKNTSLTMYLALEFAGPVAAVGPFFYIFWHNTWNAWQMFRMDRRRENRRSLRERDRLFRGDPSH